MVWDKANCEILSVKPSGVVDQDESGKEYRTIDIIGRGFYPRESHFVFVRATTDGKLQQPQIIPCYDVLIEDEADQQKITAKASFYQRQNGDYHLVGWTKIDVADKLVNNAAVFENAFELEQN
jgi:hypothetical protein